MSEREGRKFFFLLQVILAALFLIVGVGPSKPRPADTA